jgi:chromosome segregation and condensation protein ScpB
MAEASKTNSFGTFLETIEEDAAPAAEPPLAAPPEASPSPMPELSRRVLRALATAPASTAQLREQVGPELRDEVLDELVAHGFIARVPGRGVRYALTAAGQAVVQLLTA